MYHIIFYRILELIVQYGVFTDEDLEARREREKFWDAFIEGYYENEKRLFQQKYNCLKNLYENHLSGTVLDISTIKLENLKLK